MKSRLRLKVCEARQRGMEFKDEVYYCYYYYDYTTIRLYDYTTIGL